MSYLTNKSDNPKYRTSKLTRQEKIEKLVDYETTCAMDEVNDYQQYLNNKTDEEINEIYRKEYE